MSDPPFPRVLVGTNVYKGRRKERRGIVDHTHIQNDREQRVMRRSRSDPSRSQQDSRLSPLYSAEQTQPNQLIIVFVPLTWSGPWRRDVSVRRTNVRRSPDVTSESARSLAALASVSEKQRAVSFFLPSCLTPSLSLLRFYVCVRACACQWRIYPYMSILYLR